MTYAYLMLQLGTYVCGARMNFFFFANDSIYLFGLAAGEENILDFQRWISDEEFF